nr:hypothetical protein [Rickettsia endosymbiont of Cardiosporidium cionae]
MNGQVYIKDISKIIVIAEASMLACDSASAKNIYLFHSTMHPNDAMIPDTKRDTKNIINIFIDRYEV